MKSGDWLRPGNYVSSYSHIDDTGGVWANERTIDEWKVTPASGKTIKDTLFTFLRYGYPYNLKPEWYHASPWDPEMEGAYGKFPKQLVCWLSEKNDSLFINHHGEAEFLGARIKP